MLHPYRIVTVLLLLTASGVDAFSGQQKQPLSRALCHNHNPHHRHVDHQSVCLLMAPPPPGASHNEPRQKMLVLKRLWKRSKKSVASIALALTFLRSTPAMAAAVVTKDMVDVSARANDVLIESLRPGATVEDAEVALNPDVLVREREEVNTVTKKTEETKVDRKSKKKKTTKNVYYDDDEDEGDDEDAFFDDETRAQLEAAKTTPKTATTSDIYIKKSEITKASYAKALALFITAPVLLFSGIETYKRRSESAYVKKALKIQAMKREEYLNKTASEAAQMKGNETATDDDDDDDDEDGDDGDDDDSDLGKPSPNAPKKPKGGDDGGGDDAPPSADDIDRLNRLMGKK